MDLTLLGGATHIGSMGGSSRLASALTPRSSTATAKASSDDSTDNGTSSSATDNSTITADDFLTLLVSELKNQDPTQPTDPSQYISQLVGVNSLQQLIQINQGLSTFEDAVLGEGESV